MKGDYRMGPTNHPGLVAGNSAATVTAEDRHFQGPANQVEAFFAAWKFGFLDVNFEVNMVVNFL